MKADGFVRMAERYGHRFQRRDCTAYCTCGEWKVPRRDPAAIQRDQWRAHVAEYLSAVLLRSESGSSVSVRAESRQDNVRFRPHADAVGVARSLSAPLPTKAGKTG